MRKVILIIFALEKALQKRLRDARSRMYVCVCLCVCKGEKGKERERDRPLQTVANLN